MSEKFISTSELHYHMEGVDLEAGLRSLRQSLKQIRSLLAWEQLRQSETRPDRQFSFQIYDPIGIDLRNEYSFFLNAAISPKISLLSFI